MKLNYHFPKITRRGSVLTIVFCLFYNISHAEDYKKWYDMPKSTWKWDSEYDVLLNKEQGSSWDNPNTCLTDYMQLSITRMNGAQDWYFPWAGLPDDYDDKHCIKAEITKIDQTLKREYTSLMIRSSKLGQRHLISDEQKWLSKRRIICILGNNNMPTNAGSFACYMTLTSDRIKLLRAR